MILYTPTLKENYLSKMKRICIYPSDIIEILGKSLTTSQTLVRTIKDSLGKKKFQPLTIKEFCDYMDLPFEEVFNLVNNIKSKDDKKSV